MSRIARLQHAAEREAAIQDAAVEQFERLFAQLVTRLLRRLRTELRDWTVDDQERLVSDAANLGRALALRGQLAEWLQQEGFLEIGRAHV